MTTSTNTTETIYITFEIWLGWTMWFLLRPFRTVPLRISSLMPGWEKSSCVKRPWRRVQVTGLVHPWLQMLQARGQGCKKKKQSHQSHRWASLVAQTVKNLPAMLETWAWSMSGRSSGEGNGNPFQYFCLENPMDRGGWRATVHGVTKRRTWLGN